MSAHDGPAHLAWGAVWPSLEEFTELAQSRRVIPVVEKLLIDDAAPTGIFRRLAEGTGTFILESAEHDGSWNRWSFVGVRSQAQILLSPPPISSANAHPRLPNLHASLTPVPVGWCGALPSRCRRELGGIFQAEPSGTG